MQLDDYFKQIYNEYGIDRTLLIERLKLTPTQRMQEHMQFMEFVEKLQKAKIYRSHDTLRKNPQKIGSRTR